MTNTQQHTARRMYTLCTVVYIIALAMAYHQGGTGMSIYVACMMVAGCITTHFGTKR